MGQSAKDTIMNDPALQSVPAVQNGKWLVDPYGTYQWVGRSPEGALMPYFLANITYHEVFKDLYVEEETKKFYKDMYNYDLNDEEVATIMAGDK